MLLPVWLSLSTGSWTLLYCSLRLMLRASLPKSAEWSCRLVAASHACLIVIMAAVNACLLGPSPFSNPGLENGRFSELALLISLGYFLFDLVWCIIHQTEGVVILFHHVAVAVVLWLCLYFGSSGAELLTALGAGEATNPFLQIRWFLQEKGFANTWILLQVELVFVLLFIAMRFGVGSYLLYRLFTHPKGQLFIQLGGCAMMLISAIFIGQIIKIGLSKKKDSKNVETNSANIETLIQTEDQAVPHNAIEEWEKKNS